MHQKPNIRLCKACGNEIKDKLRRVYCTARCYFDIYKREYIKLIAAGTLKCKICSTNIPAGSQRRKYCSNTCYLKKQSNDIRDLRAGISKETHDCSCCNPAKQVPKNQKYCLDNAWMGRLTPAERSFNQ